MVFVLNDKKYDTEKMEKIADVKKWFKYETVILIQMFGEGSGRYYDCELWRSKKGNWLLTAKIDGGYTQGEAIDEQEARDLLKRYDLEKYEEIFGELEEA